MGLFLGLLDPELELLDFFGEGLLYVGQLLLDLAQSLVKFLLAGKFFFVLLVELRQLHIVVLLQLVQFPVFVLDFLFLGLDQFFLSGDLLLHLSALLILVIFVLLHVRLQVGLNLLDIANLVLLLLQEGLRLLQFLVLVT